MLNLPFRVEESLNGYARNCDIANLRDQRPENDPRQGLHLARLSDRRQPRLVAGQSLALQALFVVAAFLIMVA
jgi:hypothetical protein